MRASGPRPGRHGRSWSYLQGIWSLIVGLFTLNGDKLRAGTQMMWDGVNSVLMGWPQRMHQAGMDMVMGLVNGITSMGEILGGIAGDHSLKTAIAPALSAIQVPHVDQANESDVNLLTRLGKRFNAVATVKAGTLVFSPIGSGTTPSGLKLPAGTITRASGDQHRYSVGDREMCTGVRAYWNDHKAARRKSVLGGTSRNERRLQSTYATEAEARQQAATELQRSNRGAATLSIALALGRADMYPEQSISVSGFKPDIDGDDWLVSKTTHTITGNGGFTTHLEMETAAGLVV